MGEEAQAFLGMLQGETPVHTPEANGAQKLEVGKDDLQWYALEFYYFDQNMETKRDYDALYVYDGVHNAVASRNNMSGKFSAAVKCDQKMPKTILETENGLYPKGGYAKDDHEFQLEGEEVGFYELNVYAIYEKDGGHYWLVGLLGISYCADVML